MKRCIAALIIQFVPLFVAPAQIIADFEKSLSGYHVLTQYFGTALTGVAQKPDPSEHSAGVMVLRFNFPPGNSGDKGGVGVNGAIVTNGAHFITYWVYFPSSTPDSLNVSVFAQDNQNYSFQQYTLQGRNIPKNAWYPVSLDLTQSEIRTPAFNLVTGNIYVTGIQIDNFNGDSVWQDSVLVDNVALVGARPGVVADFEFGMNGFAGAGTALSAAAEVGDPTGKSSGVMQLDWKFPAGVYSNGAVVLGQAGGLVPGGARFLTYWVYFPDTTIPDSFSVSAYAEDNTNFREHEMRVRGADIPKKTWYPLSLDLARASADDPLFDLTGGNIAVTGLRVQNDGYRASIPGWTDSMFVDNVSLLFAATPPPPRKIVLAGFDTPGDVGGFSVQGFGPAFTAAVNGVDTTNASNRVLVVTAAFDTGAAYKGAIARNALSFLGAGDTAATDVAIDLFIPPTMPDSAKFDIALSGPATGNAWVQDEHVLGIDVQKGMWNTLKFNIAAHIANGSITSVRGSATAYVQAYYSPPKKWSGKLFVDNLTLLGIDLLASARGTAAGPFHFRLYDNYPNPFNPSTTIRYELRNEGEVSLTVHDILGRRVTTLVAARQTAGPHAVVFDAGAYATGVYFYTLRSGDLAQTRKMIFIR